MYDNYITTVILIILNVVHCNSNNIIIYKIILLTSYIAIYIRNFAIMHHNNIIIMHVVLTKHIVLTPIIHNFEFKLN